jgi:hypothetical protein
MTNPTPIPPKPPKNWTSVPEDLTFFGALAIFVLGVLTAAGVVVPHSVSTDVRLWAGVAQEAAGLLGGTMALISKHSVQRAQIKADSALDVALANHHA